MLFSDLKVKINQIANPIYAEKAKTFFKTSPGQYGAGDQFIGIRNPDLRNLAKEYSNLQFDSITKLINSPIHEERLLGLLILIQQYKKANLDTKKKLYRYYVSSFKQVNNWDLVDLSSPNIVGDFLFLQPKANREILKIWAKSKHLWTRRIAIISTLHFIRNGCFSDSLELAQILLQDEEDLIHKAVGWMLREVGKRDLNLLQKFLASNYRKMPRTMLRYSIEKFPQEVRQDYLNGTI